MSHYRSNLRYLYFNLFEVFGAGEVLGSAAYPEVDADSARSILAETDRLAREDLAASYADGDRNPPAYDPATHSVTMPEAFRRSYQSFMDSEFWRLDLPAELDGTPAPRILWWALAELVLGANAPVWMYASGPSFAYTMWLEGTPEQKEWAKLIVAKRWAATMVLTEPDAGSDVGAGRTRAIPQPDGSWHLEGVKRFITSGEHDLTGNIIHYVLARPVDTPGAGGPGTKGLSLFIVPKYHFDPKTGELGERNGVFATNVEYKMGLKVSTTCELTFGGHGVPATGWLLGDVHEGIRQMFTVIEYARMMVGTKAIATLSTGYLNALEYEKDRVRVAELAGDPVAAELAKRVNDLLLPLVKGVGSERAYELLGHESLQTFGGSGFLQDYPIEQYVRDAKIDTLYEGTTAIQSLDLVFRKTVRDRGRALTAIANEIQALLDSEVGNGQLKDERVALGTALGEVQQILAVFTGWLMAAQGGEPRELYKIGLNSRRLLLTLGDLVIGWLLVRQADVALQALGQPVSAADQAFYQGKVAAARFFTHEVLPRIGADRRIVESTTLDAMEIPEEAF